MPYESIDCEPGRRRYRVRWREDGSQRSRRFLSRSAAEAFAASPQPAPESPPIPSPAEPDGSGVYAYATTGGATLAAAVSPIRRHAHHPPRGFESRSAAVAARRAAVEAVRGGQLKVVSRATFAECWFKFLELK